MRFSVSFVEKALYDCGDGTDVTQAKTFFDQPLQAKLRWRLQEAELNQGYTARQKLTSQAFERLLTTSTDSVYR
jgi:isopenicillin N synthase-like dioxygenase